MEIGHIDKVHTVVALNNTCCNVVTRGRSLVRGGEWGGTHMSHTDVAEHSQTHPAVHPYHNSIGIVYAATKLARKRLPMAPTTNHQEGSAPLHKARDGVLGITSNQSTSAPSYVQMGAEMGDMADIHDEEKDASVFLQKKRAAQLSGIATHPVTELDNTIEGQLRANNAQKQ